MKIWAIADLHLCLSCPDKTMEDFGHQWDNYIERIQKNWTETVNEEDWILIAGDISWALKIHEVKVDLDWIGALPGKKVMIRGNHDYWWKSLKQIKSVLPESIHLIQNDALNLDKVSIGGTRLWDTLEFNNSEIIDYKENPKANPNVVPLTTEENEKIFQKELSRLELSLSKMQRDAPIKIVMTHYPPIRHDLTPQSKVHQMLKDYSINYCVFGHMHNLLPKLPPLFGEKDGVKYIFTAADYLKFHPKLISSF